MEVGERERDDARALSLLMAPDLATRIVRGRTHLARMLYYCRTWIGCHGSSKDRGRRRI